MPTIPAQFKKVLQRVTKEHYEIFVEEIKTPNNELKILHQECRSAKRIFSNGFKWKSSIKGDDFWFPLFISLEHGTKTEQKKLHEQITWVDKYQAASQETDSQF